VTTSVHSVTPEVSFDPTKSDTFGNEAQAEARNGSGFPTNDSSTPPLEAKTHEMTSPPTESQGISIPSELVGRRLTEQEGALTSEEIQAIDEEIERNLDPDSKVTAFEIWENMRYVSRKVVRLVQEALEINQKLPREMSNHEETISLPQTDSIIIRKCGISWRHSKLQLSRYVIKPQRHLISVAWA
jgi:uncharacterized protein YuzE